MPTATAQTDRQLLADLLAKLKITPQALAQQRDRLKTKVPMPTAIATYIIAQRRGLKLDRYLDLETIETVNRFIRDLEAKEAPVALNTAPVRPPTQRRTPARREIRFDRFRVSPDTLTPAHVRQAEKMAGEVYPILYVFENSAREFIDRHLSAAYGQDWFGDPEIVSRDIRQIVGRNRKAEDRNRYHSQRQARPIYYTDLDHLSRIVQSTKGWRIFKQLFPRPTFFPELVGRFEVSRNVVAHMNPLGSGEIKRLEHGLEDWLRQIARHPGPNT